MSCLKLGVRSHLLSVRIVNFISCAVSLLSVLDTKSSFISICGGSARPFAMASLKVAVIGQSVFGLEVYKLLRKKGHTVVGVFTIPDVNGKSDPLGAEAEKDGVPVFKFKAWRAKATGQVLPGVFEKYKSVDAELNVLPFCSQFIPMDVINHPKHKSIIYHPSILPRHRGASAINW